MLGARLEESTSNSMIATSPLGPTCAAPGILFYSEVFRLGSHLRDENPFAHRAKPMSRPMSQTPKKKRNPQLHVWPEKSLLNPMNSLKDTKGSSLRIVGLALNLAGFQRHTKSCSSAATQEFRSFVRFKNEGGEQPGYNRVERKNDLQRLKRPKERNQ